MPLPPLPTRRPSKLGAFQSGKKADQELLFKGVLCALIGIGVLVSPYFITSPGMQDAVGKAWLVGWFALMLGCGFVGIYILRRRAAANTD